MKSQSNNLLTIFFTAIFLIGCGGGGSEGEKQSTNKNITISRLPTTASINEGELVTLSLNTQGDDSNALSYDWEVKRNNEQISFSGQNTDTITFISPDVVNTGTISVSVKIDLSNGVLIGPKSQQSLITINDLNPPAEIQAYELAKTTVLPEVEILDTSSFISESTWVMTNYTTSNYTDDNAEYTIQQTTIVPFTIKNTDAHNINLMSCGADIPNRINITNYGVNKICNEESRSVKYYQEDENLRLELMCENKVVQASNFKKISNTNKTDLGELSLKFDTYNDQSTVTDICGTVTINEIRTAGSNNEGLITSNVTLISEYLGEPLEISIDLAEEPEFNLFLFFAQRNSAIKLNGVTLNSSMLPTIDNIKEQSSGSVTITSFSLPSLTGRFDINITDKNDSIENVESEFTLILE